MLRSQSVNQYIERANSQVVDGGQSVSLTLYARVYRLIRILNTDIYI